MQGPLLDMDAVAEMLGVGRRHVQRMVTERRIPFVKVGRFVRWIPLPSTAGSTSSGWSRSGGGSKWHTLAVRVPAIQSSRNRDARDRSVSVRLAGLWIG